jgi:hypothetical protein
VTCIGMSGSLQFIGMSGSLQFIIHIKSFKIICPS